MRSRGFRGGRRGGRAFGRRRAPSFDPSMIDPSMLTPEAILQLGMQAQELLDRKGGYFGSPRRPFRGRGGGRGSRRPAGRVSKQGFPRRGFKTKPARPRNPFHCFFCNIDTRNKKNHVQHQQTQRHADSAKSRQNFLNKRLHELAREAADKGHLAKTRGRVGGFCTICCACHEGSLQEHKKTKLHMNFLFLVQVPCVDCDIIFQDRLSFEKHLLKMDHIRNRTCKLLEDPNFSLPKSMLALPEKKNADTKVGEEFIGDVSGLYCKICDELFQHDECSPVAHSKTERHYEKFKEYVQKRKAGLIKPKIEKEEEDKAETINKEEDSTEYWDESITHDDDDDDDEGVEEKDEPMEEEGDQEKGGDEEGDDIEESDEDAVEEGDENAVEEGDEDAAEEGDEDAAEEGDEDAIEEGDEDAVEEGDEDAVEEGDEDVVEGDEDAVEEGDDDAVEEGDDDAVEEGDEDAVEEGDDVEEGDGVEESDEAEETTENKDELQEEELDYDMEEDEPEDPAAKKADSSPPPAKRRTRSAR